ncbi:aminodeoxychorismate synthase component I [Gordonia alkaliphila]|uniref:Aminodeoxychorismate synthase component I n=1 Tax=Gordonia alkaliphila TaxID=1053547 RepID=A0ABP8ZIX7_9ACTN|nr:aminodeoxychorismate synthase component I [Gordonia alkaliphila]MCK0439744.1 aminodeoxychorismate synthase component I [Gordonia alkaliphila]
MNAASALDLFGALADAADAAGRPGPAALIGDWCDAEAVIAPSIELVPGLRPPDRPDRFWLGYLGFPVRGEQGPLPPAVGGLTDGILVLRDGRWSWESPVGAPLPDWLPPLSAGAPAPRSAWSTSWTPPERAPHLAAVSSCLEAIAAGEVYQACICTRFTGRLDGAPHRYFADLAAATKPAKAAFLHGDWGTVASLSPETFLSRRSTTVTSSPIKGTVPRNVDPMVLAESGKDIAENVMIVDLVRNDLGRVARTGTVRVPELLTVVGAPGVWHLVSTVAAELDDAVGNDALLDAAFPPASVTGTPKIRAAELISEWEAQPRGVYCGAVGIAGPDGLLDLNVAIRTVSITPDGALTLGVGGGITYDSDPAAEWQECLDKAAAILAHTRSN